MQKVRKTYKATKADLEELGEIQDSAAELMKQYLLPSVRAMRAKNPTPGRVEVASALVMLAYYILRKDAPKPKAKDTLDALAYFGMRRVESKIEQRRRERHKLH